MTLQDQWTAERNSGSFFRFFSKFLLLAPKKSIHFVKMSSSSFCRDILFFISEKDDMKPPKPPAHQNEGCRLALNQTESDVKLSVRRNQTRNAAKPPQKNNLAEIQGSQTSVSDRLLEQKKQHKKQLFPLIRWNQRWLFEGVVLVSFLTNPLRNVNSKRINEWQLKKKGKHKVCNFSVMCISAWRLIFGIFVHWSLPPSAWTYFLRVNLSLSLALGVNLQTCWAWTIGWGQIYDHRCQIKPCETGRKTKTPWEKSHGPNISQDAIVAVVKVKTKNVCDRPGGGRDTSTSHWPLNVHFCTPRPVFFSIFGVFGLGNHTYTIPPPKKKQHLQQTISAPNNQQLPLPTYQNPNPFPANSVFFFSYPFCRRTEQFGSPRWAAHGFFASQRRCWVHRRPSTHQRWETSNGRGRATSYTSRAVTWQVGNWLVGWLVGWIGFFNFGLQKYHKGTWGDVCFLQQFSPSYSEAGGF